MRANTTVGPKRPKVKVVTGAAGLIVAGLALAACTSVAGAAKTTTNAQPGQYRQATYPAAPARVSEREQFRAEHAMVLPAKAKVSGTAGDNHQSLRLEQLAR